MPESNRFFHWLYRLLAIAGLVLILVIGVVLARTFLGISAWRDRQAVEVPKQDSSGKPVMEKLRFTGLETIAGRGTRMVRVEAEAPGRGNSLSSGYGGAPTRNLVFIDEGFGKARWLFADNHRHIDGIRKLCACESGDRADEPVVAIYLQVRGVDTNNDGRIDEDDHVVPALVQPDGSGYRPLMPAVEDVLDTVVADDGGSLGILVQKEDSLLYREYSTADGTMRAERELSRLGGN